MTNQKTFVQLGRYGDILNILPLVKKYRDDSGQQPALMVAQDYAGLLDGVSYCDRLVYEGEFTSLSKALFKARLHSSDVVSSQIYGDICADPPKSDSFAIDSWLKAGANVPCGTLPLIIDKRDSTAERLLLEKYTTKDTPFVLVALDGISSPFPFNKMAWTFIEHSLGRDFDLIDLCKIRAERFHDLLGLIDRAHCVITIDTGILHLCAASETPVISLITRSPSPWHGSPWRPNHVGRFYYDEFPQAFPELVERARHAHEATPEIFHVFSEVGYSEIFNDAARRHAVAHRSWEIEYSTGYWRELPFLARDMERNGYGIGDERPVPYLRDMIQFAASKASREDIIAFTNSDVSFAPGLTGKVLEAITRHGAAFTHRWDFNHLTEPFVSSAQVRFGKFYCGSDAFFFTKWWWKVHGHELPDFLIGREQNDEVLRQLIKYHGGAEIEKMIYHEEHESFWERPGNRENLAGNIYNRKLAKEWFQKMGLRENDWLWWSAHKL